MRACKSFLLFVLIGGFSSAVNLVTRILIDRVTSYEVSIVLAFPVALTTAFLLNRTFVFEAVRDSWYEQFVRFLLVNLAALVQVFLISVLFARVIFPTAGMHIHPDTVAHAIGLLSPIVTSYWAHKHFSFRGVRAADDTRGARS